MKENKQQISDEQIIALTNEFACETKQRKIALLCSLMGNMTFVVAAYAILCYDQSGRVFGQLLGL